MTNEELANVKNRIAARKALGLTAEQYNEKLKREELAAKAKRAAEINAELRTFVINTLIGRNVVNHLLNRPK